MSSIQKRTNTPNASSAPLSLNLASIQADSTLRPDLNKVLSPRSVSTTPGKRFPVRFKCRKEHEALKPRECPRAWEKVHTCLKDVEGLTVKEDSINAVPKAGKNALGAFAKAIGILVKKGYPGTAWKLVRMVEPWLRLELLAQCEHETELKTSDDAEVRKAMNFAMNIAAHHAWTRQDLSQFFKLLPLCSLDAKSNLTELCGPLTGEMLNGLDGHAFIEAVRTELERPQTPDTAAYLMRTLTEASRRWDPGVFSSHAQPLGDILQKLAGKLDALQDVDGLAKLVRKLLDNASTAEEKSDTLLAAVALVANLPEIEHAVAHLQRLSLLLSLRLDAALVGQLQIRIRSALFERSVDDKRIHTIMMGVLHISRKAQGVQQALSDGDPEKAKQMIVGTEDFAYYQAASARVIKFRPGKSAGGSIQALAPTTIDPKEEAAKQQISMVLDGLGAHGHELRSRMCRALPKLCSGANGYELDFILASREGQALVAQAVIDHLSTSPTAAEIVSLFTALADRVDLHAAISASSKGILELIETQLANVQLTETGRAKCTHNLNQWSRGWRLLWLMHLGSWLLRDPDPRLRRAVLAVDAAASDARPGDTVRREDSLVNPGLRDYAQDALSAMLGIEVSDGQPFLSNDALRNVMRVVAGDEGLAKSTFEWMEERPAQQKVRLYAASARALVSLLRESPLFLTNGQLATSDAASHVTSQLIRQPEVAEAVQSRMTKDEWEQLWIMATAKM